MFFVIVIAKIEQNIVNETSAQYNHMCSQSYLRERKKQTLLTPFVHDIDGNSTQPALVYEYVASNVVKRVTA